jgi:hypothetical protein
MDVSTILAEKSDKRYKFSLKVILRYSTYNSKAITVEKGIPIEVDAGLLCAIDLNPVDDELYRYSGLLSKHKA